MKYDNLFTHYVKEVERVNLHPKYEEIYDNLPEDINDFKNIILYGGKGIGKYSQCLNIIKRYSPSSLKYENKFSINFQNKHCYNYKISDIHYEVDMSLLGCNSKTLWGDIFQQIIDIITLKQNKTGIIVCKYFNEINSELLDVFYTYMYDYQNTFLTKINIKYILITENLSFIPENILNICNIIPFKRPSRTQYNSILETNNINNKIDRNIDIEEITNIKDVKLNITQLLNPQELICDKIITNITNIDEFSITNIRDYLYDLLISNINIYDSVWYIIRVLVEDEFIHCDDLQDVLNETYIFLKQYNNNYRPIFHLERYIIYLCKSVNDI